MLSAWETQSYDITREVNRSLVGAVNTRFSISGKDSVSGMEMHSSNIRNSPRPEGKSAVLAGKRITCSRIKPDTKCSGLRNKMITCRIPQVLRNVVNIPAPLPGPTGGEAVAIWAV